MARPTFRSVASATAGYNSTNAANPATYQHAGIGGANKIIYVFATSNGGDESAWTCTVGGAATARVSPSAAPASAAAVWRLVAPADGDLTVSVSHDQAAGTMIVNSIVLNDAAQTGLAENFTAGTSGTGTNPTVTQTSDADSLVIDFLFSRAFVEGVNQTTTQRSLANSGNAGQAIGQKDGAASTTMGWTVQASGDTNYDMSVSVLGITASGPTIDTQPVADTVLINGDAARASASFTVAATGTGTLSYQWELETSVGGGVYANVADGSGATWAGATATNLTATFTAKTLTGRRVRCVVTDDNGSTTTNAVALTVYTGPVLSASSGTTNASGVDTLTITSDYPNADGEFTVVTATAGGVTKQVALHYETPP